MAPEVKWGKSGGIGGPLSDGIGDGEFNSPMGMTTDGTLIYVVDMTNNRIQAFDQNGNFVRKWSTQAQPTDIAFDGSSLYVVGNGTNQVQKFDTLGNPQTGWLAPNTNNFICLVGTKIILWVSGSGQLRVFDLNGNVLSNFTSGTIPEPNDLWADANEFFILDQNNSKVRVYNWSGTQIRNWGNIGSLSPDLMISPSSLSVANGLVFITDIVNEKIKVFTDQGTFITQYGSFGSELGRFVFPRHSLLLNNKLYISEAQNHRVQRFGVCLPTITPTVTISPTVSQTPTPTNISTEKFLSNLGKNVLGPNPVKIGEDICFYQVSPSSSSEWIVYNSAGERVSILTVSGREKPCLSTRGFSPGIYFAVVKFETSANTKTHISKIIVVP